MTKRSVAHTSKKRSRSSRWRIVENVVAAIERVTGKAGNWQVSQNVMIARRDSSQRRQVDVLAVCPSGAREFRVGIDVKDEKKPLGIEAMEQLCAKRASLSLDSYVVVSTSGFTRSALDEAKRHGVQAVKLLTAAFAKVFAIPHVNFENVRIVSFGGGYLDKDVQVPKGRMSHARMELADRVVALNELATPFVMKCYSDHPELGDGVIRKLTIRDNDRQWKQLHTAEGAFPAPSLLDVYWVVEKSVLEGHTFSLEDGREAFSTVLPFDGKERQVTFVLVPAEGGHRLSVAVGDARPARSDG